MSSRVRCGYASRRRASDTPSLSLRRMSSTGTRSADHWFPKHHTRVDLDTIDHRHTIARNIPTARSRDLYERLTAFQRRDNRAEVSFDAAQQFCPPRVSDPNPDDGRTFLQNPANREVLIFCADHRVGLRCVAANRIGGRSGKPTNEDARPSGRALQGAAPAQVAAERRRESAIMRSAGRGDRSGGRRIPVLP